MISSYEPTLANLEQLREQFFRSKAEHRRDLIRLPILQKLKILEKMRDFTSALQTVRDENKARMKGAWVGKAETDQGDVI